MAADFPNSPTENQKYRISAARTNLLTNPNFETDITGWATTGTVARTTSEFFIGTACVSMTYAGSGTVLIDQSPRPAVTAGSAYTASFYLKQSVDTGSVICNFMWYDSGSSLILDDVHQTNNPTTSWQRFSQTRTAPANAVSCSVRIYQTLGEGGGAVATVNYIDAVLFEQSSQLLPYFDGTFSKGEMYQQQWTGTANASTSTGRYYLSPGFNHSSSKWSVVSGDAGGEPISTANIRAKGDLIAGSGSASVTFRTVGTNGQLLTADSTTASGLNYTNAPASSATSLGAITNVTLTSVAENEGLTWNGTAWVNSSYPFFGDYVINRKSAAYTLQLTDKNKLLEISSDVTVQVTVPTNAVAAFPNGSQIHLIQLGTGQVTVGGAGVTFNGRTKLRDQYSMATLIKRATDTWVLSGDIAD